MSRIPAIDPAQAQGKAKTLLDAVHKALGVTPNLFRVAAQSPAALEGLVALNTAVQQNKLGPKLREQIALATAERNGCDYCLAAHTYLGKHAGLSEADIDGARADNAADPKAQAALRFTAQIIATHGHPSDGDLEAARAGGLGDADLVASIALNIFTNYLNETAKTEIDFPVVRTHAAG